MTALNRAGHTRSVPRTGRRVLAALGAAAIMLPLGAGAASAQSFINPADPCHVPAPPAPFADRGSIPAVHQVNVDCAFALEIVLGRERGGQRFFDGDGPVNRDMMAGFIVRTLEAAGYELPAPQDQGFTDTAGATFRDEINQLAQIGITVGKTETTYSPAELVPRDQMASFVVRSAEFAYAVDGVSDELEGQTEPGTPFPFNDVADGNTHRLAIQAAAQLIAVAEGKVGGGYDPGMSISRAQMATFMVRLVDVTLVPEP